MGAPLARASRASGSGAKLADQAAALGRADTAWYQRRKWLRPSGTGSFDTFMKSTATSAVMSATPGDIGPLRKLAVEELEEVGNARLVGLTPFRHLPMDQRLHERVQVLKHRRDRQEQMKLDAPVPHFHQRAFECAAAEQRRIGVEPLE